MMMEAEKSHSVVCNLRPQESQRASGIDSRLSLKTWEPGAPRLGGDQFPSSQAESKFNLPLPVCTMQALTGEGTYFTQSSNSNAPLFQKHLHRHIQKSV